MDDREFATKLRQVHELREASWGGNPPAYTRHYPGLITEVFGNSPWAKIADCLFTAGYCEMWEFCDEILGPEQPTGN